MGINLKPEVNEFLIQPNAFFIKTNSSVVNPPGTIAITNGSVEEGCATEGLHTLLRFNFIVKNAGDQDLEIGKPSERLDIFEPAKHDPRKWITKKIVNEYYLKDKNKNTISSGKKRYYCIKDTSGKYTCDHQGISVGNKDTYTINELCNFLVIDNLLDDDNEDIYLFEAITNVSRIFQEDNYDDNTISIKLKINISERIADIVE
jgi:hypothetical protein